MKHTLSNGIIIHDNRHLSCGVRIENNPYEKVSLRYASETGLFLITKSGWIKDNEVDDFISQLVIMREILQEANAILESNKDGR